MFKSLAIKELRESIGIVAIGMIAVAYMLLILTGMKGLTQVFGFFEMPFTYREDSVPFVTDDFWFSFLLIAGFIAIALGLKQSAVEAMRDTYYFLLHLPASRRSVFGTKLAIGLGLLFAVGSTAIFTYALWAATPGNNAAPFYWSMTTSAWQTLFCAVVLYLGAFLSGIRPARWFGTRLAPLAAAAFLAFFPWTFDWRWFAPILLTTSVCLFIVAIFYYAENRDY